MARLLEPEFYRSDFRHPGMEGHRIFYPWAGHGDFGAVARRAGYGTGNFRLYVIWTLALQAAKRHPGADLWECGVWKGHSAKFLAEIARLAGSRLHLFDTFEGMPQTDPEKDFHRKGNFADTSLDGVKAFLSEYGASAIFHPGFIPDTFAGLESAQIAFVNIDVDIYKSVKDSLEFVYPRMLPGGTILFDDYGWHSCPGAREAVDEFAERMNLLPLILPSGQAVITK
jgi:O-methyltransferase